MRLSGGAAANDGVKVEDAMACRLPYDKMKSISTGDILDTSGNAGWLLKCTSPDSIERRVLCGVGAVPGDYHFTVCHSLNRARQLYKNISMLFLFPVKRDLLFTDI